MTDKVHHIEIGGIQRDLPVREVKPGVFVALFNPLGGNTPFSAGKKVVSARAILCWLALMQCPNSSTNKDCARTQLRRS